LRFLLYPLGAFSSKQSVTAKQPGKAESARAWLNANAFLLRFFKIFPATANNSPGSFVIKGTKALVPVRRFESRRG
jgi:hypothetical protein